MVFFLSILFFHALLKPSLTTGHIHGRTFNLSREQVQASIRNVAVIKVITYTRASEITCQNVCHQKTLQCFIKIVS